MINNQNQRSFVLEDLNITGLPDIRDISESYYLRKLYMALRRSIWRGRSKLLTYHFNCRNKIDNISTAHPTDIWNHAFNRQIRVACIVPRLLIPYMWGLFFRRIQHWVFSPTPFSNIKSSEIMSSVPCLFCRSMPKLFVGKSCSEVFSPVKISYKGRGNSRKWTPWVDGP